MRSLRLACFALCVNAGLVACSTILGDFSVSPGGASDAGAIEGATTDAPMPMEATPGVCQAVVSGPDVYVGQLATVDGSKSTGANLSFSWTVRSAPSGSLVATASLQDPRSATASFVPDVAGNYDLVLAVSSATCNGSSATQRVVARSPQVIFAQGNVADTGPSATYTVADLDGGNAHALMCSDTIVTSVPNQIAMLAAYAGRAYDFWEAPSGQPSRYAAFTLDDSADAYFTHLWAGTTASTCASPPADLATNGFGPGPPFGTEPHFRPDGLRFVVYDEQWNVVTYASEGSTAGTVVSSYTAGQNTPVALDASFDPVPYERPAEPPRVEWTAAGLAWARPTATGWEIVTAPDTAASSGFVPTPYMHCGGVTPRQIALLRDGTVIAGFRQTPSSGEDIYLLKPDSTQACIFERRYTSSSDTGTATATDFAVSPDGNWLAFLALDPTTQDASPWTFPPNGLYPGGYVYVVAVGVSEGGTPQPQQVSTEPAIYGPRWIGGGAFLVFTRLDGTSHGSAPATSVVVVSPDGGAEHVVASGDGITTFVSTSGSAGCGVVGAASGGAPTGAGSALGGLAVLAAMTRRRRRGASSGCYR